MGEGELKQIFRMLRASVMSERWTMQAQWWNMKNINLTRLYCYYFRTTIFMVIIYRVFSCSIYIQGNFLLLTELFFLSILSSEEPEFWPGPDKVSRRAFIPLFPCSNSISTLKSAVPVRI